MNRFAIAVLAALFATAAGAQMKGMERMDMKMEKKEDKKADGHTHHGSGVVKAVNAEKGTVRIEHQAIASLNWPAMTMSFKAKEKTSLQSLKPGQKVEFDFVQQGKDYVITGLR